MPPSLTSPAPAYRPWLGIFFMCVACALFPVQNAVVKLLTSLYPFQEVVWARLATHLVLALLIYASIVWTLRRLGEREPLVVSARMRVASFVLVGLILLDYREA